MPRNMIAAMSVTMTAVVTVAMIAMMNVVMQWHVMIITTTSVVLDQAMGFIVATVCHLNTGAIITSLITGVNII